MAYLTDNRIPITIHSVLGLNNDLFKNVHLIQYAVEMYPENIIIIAHMGLSKEQNKVSTKNHIALMQHLLREYQNLYLDISWGILEDNFFSRDRIGYVGLINKFPNRFINGTNFIAQDNFGFEEYYSELQAVSEIHRYISDKAFRHIALGQTYFGLLGKDTSALNLFNS